MRPIDADVLESYMAGPFVKTYRECREAVRNAPTLDVVPVVHAKARFVPPWKPGAMVTFWRAQCICSNCGDRVSSNWNYCQNCGAKMDGGDTDA